MTPRSAYERVYSQGHVGGYTHKCACFLRAPPTMLAAQSLILPLQPSRAIQCPHTPSASRSLSPHDPHPLSHSRSERGGRWSVAPAVDADVTAVPAPAGGKHAFSSAPCSDAAVTTAASTAAGRALSPASPHPSWAFVSPTASATPFHPRSYFTPPAITRYYYDRLYSNPPRLSSPDPHLTTTVTPITSLPTALQPSQRVSQSTAGHGRYPS